MTSKLFRLNLRELGETLVTAVLGAVIFAIAGIVGPDFNVFTANWVAVGAMAVNAGFYTFVSTLAANILTTKEGKLLGMVEWK